MRNTISPILELANHDMIYVYHHLKVDGVVEVRKGKKGQVFFKGFFLGYVDLEIRETCTATITTINKQKFMPIEGMEITINE